MTPQRRHSSPSGPWRRLLLFAVASLPSIAASQLYLPVETAKPIAKRQSCIDNFYSCASLGAAFAGVCCQNGQTCSLDANNQPACCPERAVCTGTAPASFVTPAPTATAVSYVPNVYFSFPYVATYFPDAGYCSAAISQCSANFGACTSELGGQAGSGGITIVVPGGGGTTVTGGAQFSLGVASATSICSSLSSVACSNLQPSMCSLSGTTQSGFSFGTGVPNPAPARPTAARVGLAGAVVAGLAVVNAF
ncbi:hypothetical protein B0T22DRAFT_97097 [Podospora appendiculata]|uniref:Gpi-anchored protein n=1 Tax=Podospora appendiculata TaxID=314037 RepID=A0AAE0XKR5_9PEZI|nr:hypothetical protein B0T22DRAFT_97097 [Podospora appendiculata]